MGGVSSLGALLNRLHLEHYAAPFEDEAIEDVALLKSMGRQGLYDNLCGEMGLDAAGGCWRLLEAEAAASCYWRRLAVLNQLCPGPAGGCGNVCH